MLTRKPDLKTSSSTSLLPHELQASANAQCICEALSRI